MKKNSSLVFVELVTFTDLCVTSNFGLKRKNGCNFYVRLLLNSCLSLRDIRQGTKRSSRGHGKASLLTAAENRLSSTHKNLEPVKR